MVHTVTLPPSLPLLMSTTAGVAAAAAEHVLLTVLHAELVPCPPNPPLYLSGSPSPSPSSSLPLSLSLPPGPSLPLPHALRCTKTLNVLSCPTPSPPPAQCPPARRALKAQ